MQGIMGLDYPKEEQMQFTMKFYHYKIAPLLENHKAKVQGQRMGKIVKKLIKYLEIYDRIWAIPQTEQQHCPSVKDYVKNHLIGRSGISEM